MFTTVLAVRHTEAEGEIKTFKHPIPKIMFFYHPEVFHWFSTNCKLHSKMELLLLWNVIMDLHYMGHVKRRLELYGPCKKKI